ncbi:hypothetical protein EDC01DRAFT_310823 [Geopyxis carbonaria]|nr:hypothetical protein EDC01DRAFT_310823 [Geopyxis carbonaria]
MGDVRSPRQLIRSGSDHVRSRSRSLSATQPRYCLYACLSILRSPHLVLTFSFVSPPPPICYQRLTPLDSTTTLAQQNKQIQQQKPSSHGSYPKNPCLIRSRRPLRLRLQPKADPTPKSRTRRWLHRPLSSQRPGLSPKLGLPPSNRNRSPLRWRPLIMPGPRPITMSMTPHCFRALGAVNQGRLVIRKKTTTERPAFRWKTRSACDMVII